MSFFVQFHVTSCWRRVLYDREYWRWKFILKLLPFWIMDQKLQEWENLKHLMKKKILYPIIVGNYWGANCVNTGWVWHIFPLRFLLVETTSASVEECKTASNSGSVSRGRNRKAFKRQDTPRVEADIEKFCASATSRHRHPILHSKSVNAPFVSAGIIVHSSLYNIFDLFWITLPTR